MYKVIDIIEPDFGCEGLPDGQEIYCEVILENNRECLTVKIPDAELYQKDINIHTVVAYHDGVIEKISD